MVYTPSPTASTQAPSLTLTLLLVACIVVSVFYGGLFAIFAIWTSSARWRHDMQVFIGLAADRLARSASRLVRRSVAGVLSRRTRLGNISPANSAMMLLEVDGLTGLESTRQQQIRPDYASAFPLYSPPTTLPMPAITSTLIEDRTPSKPPSMLPSAQEQEQMLGYMVYPPRDGYIPPEWPPKPKQPHARTYRYILASGIIVDLEKMVRVRPAILPWYADN